MFPVFPNRAVGGLRTNDLLPPPIESRGVFVDNIRAAPPLSLPELTRTALQILRVAPDDFLLLYFSPKNMSDIQRWLKLSVYTQTNHAAAIDDQPETAILMIMINKFATENQNIREKDPKKRLDILNNLVVYEASNKVLVNLGIWLTSLTQQTNTLTNIPSLPVGKPAPLGGASNRY